MQNKNTLLSELRNFITNASSRAKAYWYINAFLISLIYASYNFVDIVDGKEIFTLYMTTLIIFFVIYLITILIASLGYKNILLIDPIFKVFMIFYISYAGAPLLLSSPYPMTSHLLHNMDVWLGFNTLDFTTWMFKHPYLVKVSGYCYEKWYLLAIFLITIVRIKKERIYVERILIILQIAVIGLSAFAFFFPSLAPATYLQAQISQLQGHDAFSRFLEYPYQLQEYYNARHHLSIMINGGFFAGFVAFPSFHTFTLLLMIRICWQKLKILFIPMVIYSIIVLISILGLGHHYIADLGGAILLFYFSIELEKLLFARSPSH